MKKEFLITNEILLFIYLVMSLFIIFWMPKIRLKFIKLYKQFKFVLDEAKKIKRHDKTIETESFILLRSTETLIVL